MSDTRPTPISRGIYSHMQEVSVGTALRERGIHYYLIYRLMIETGITYKRLVHMKAGQLKNLNNLQYTSRLGYPREMPVSEELSRDLTEFLSNKLDHDYAFTGRDKSRPLFESTMRQALSCVSKDCGITPPLNMTSLHMTFVYHLIQKDGNCQRAKQYLHAGSVKRVYEYLGLDLPEKEAANEIIKNAGAVILKQGLLDTVSDRANASFYQIGQVLSKDPSNDEYMTKALTFLKQIDEAVSAFRAMD